MDSQIVKGGTELFHTYLNLYADQVKHESVEGYYHVDIVAEAYNQGFKDGNESGKKDFVEEMRKNRIEKFIQRSSQVYILTKKVVSYLNENKFCVESLHIDVLHFAPRVIISISNELLTNDDFVQLSYAKIFEMKRIFSDLFNTHLDMGLVSAAFLNKEMLAEDGFGYSENLNS